MANLIITIISIALVGVAVAMAAYFGGTAFSGSQAQIYANTLISESQQLYLADTQYMLDHGLSSFSDFNTDQVALAGYTQGRVPIMGVPAFGYNPSLQGRDQNLGDEENSYDRYGVEIGGQTINAYRANGIINGTNAIVYYISELDANDHAIDLAPASMADNFLVQVCKDINKQMPPPAGIAYTDSGIPQMDAGTSTYGGFACGNNCFMSAYTDTTRTTLNYCYTGPPGSTNSIIFAFSN